MRGRVGSAARNSGDLSVDMSGLGEFVKSEATSKQQEEESRDDFRNAARAAERIPFLDGGNASAKGGEDSNSPWIDAHTWAQGEEQGGAAAFTGHSARVPAFQMPDESTDALANVAEGDEAEKPSKQWKDLTLWANAKRSNLSFSTDDDVKFSGETVTANMGAEKEVGGKALYGVAVSGTTGELDMDDRETGLKGQAELAHLGVMPYGAYRTDSGRVWGTLGVGTGSLDYKDTHSGVQSSGSSDVKMGMVAAGAEQDIVKGEHLDLVGRVEGMSVTMETEDDADGLYDKQKTQVHGARGEFELGWSSATGAVRPYVTAGYRWDGGDGETGSAVEYGGGLEIDTDHLSLEGSWRKQAMKSDGEFSRDSYSVELSYDRDRDRKGLTVYMKNSAGASGQDPFTKNMSWAKADEEGKGGQSDSESNTSIEAGYGFEVREGRVLRPYIKTEIDDSRPGMWNMGLSLDGDDSNIEMQHTYRPAEGPGGGDHEVIMTLELDF